MLHSYEQNGKIYFWNENRPAMELPRALSLFVRGLDAFGKLLPLGEVWYVDAKHRKILLDSVYDRCSTCSSGACPKFSRYIDFWEREYHRRVEQAEQAQREASSHATHKSKASRDLPQSPPVKNLQQEAARVLGISIPCTRSDVRSAFAKATLRSHPDVGGSSEHMKRLIAARDLLMKACKS